MANSAITWLVPWKYLATSWAGSLSPFPRLYAEPVPPSVSILSGSSTAPHRASPSQQIIPNHYMQSQRLGIYLLYLSGTSRDHVQGMGPLDVVTFSCPMQNDDWQPRSACVASKFHFALVRSKGPTLTQFFGDLIKHAIPKSVFWQVSAPSWLCSKDSQTDSILPVSNGRWIVGAMPGH